MRSVLVLEGGGLRGAFGAGVLSELERQAAPRFSDVVAVSSGAPTAAYYGAHQLSDAITIWREHCHSSQLVDPRNVLRRRPIMDLDRLVGVFQRVVPLDPAAFATSATRVWIGVTDCATGRSRYVRAGAENVFELLRATMALPVAYGRTVLVDGAHAVDGGIAAPVALAHALSLAPERLVVVTTRPAGFQRAPAWLRDRLVAWTYPRHRALRAALVTHVARANAIGVWMEHLEARGMLSVIRPACELPATRLSRDRAAIHATIECGVVAAREWLARK